jgi:alpha-tubulin suppressor-like RCC1 family protein
MACGEDHTLAVTKAGTLWSWGNGASGKLGHNDENNRLVLTQVESQHFGHAKIVSATAGEADAHRCGDK